ncbi:MAG: four helix bundle protein [Planctomycetaceae bacterium]|nr:four helix bundle protein [Planctomycetaceae bacterium]
MSAENDRSVFDLEERLLEFAARIIRFAEALPNTAAGRHVAGQVLRSGSSPMAQHGEAQAAESRRDFIHKMKIALKELRETDRWLKLIHRVPLLKKTELLEPLIQETDELIRVFVTSIKTAEAKK